MKKLIFLVGCFLLISCLFSNAQPNRFGQPGGSPLGPNMEATGGLSAFEGTGGIVVSTNAGRIVIDGSGISAGATPTYVITNRYSATFTNLGGSRFVGTIHLGSGITSNSLLYVDGSTNIAGAALNTSQFAGTSTRSIVTGAMTTNNNWFGANTNQGTFRQVGDVTGVAGSFWTVPNIILLPNGIIEFPADTAPSTSARDLAVDADHWGGGRGTLQFNDGIQDTTLVGALKSDTPSNGQVPTWNTGGTVTWETPSAGAGTTNYAAIFVTNNLLGRMIAVSGNTITATVGDKQFANVGVNTNLNYVPYPGQETNASVTIVQYTLGSGGPFYVTNNGVVLNPPGYTNAGDFFIVYYSIINGLTNTVSDGGPIYTNAIPGQFIGIAGDGKVRNLTAPSGGAGTPFGSSTWIQYNTSGAFDGTNRLAFLEDQTALILNGVATTGSNVNRAKLVITNDTTGNIEYNSEGVSMRNSSSFRVAFGQDGAGYGTNIFNVLTTRVGPAVSNSLDSGSFSVPWKTNYAGSQRAMDSVTVDGAGSNGTVQLATSLTIPDHLTNVFGFDRVTQTYFIKIPNTNVTINGNTEDYAPLVFNPQTFAITNGAPVWQVGVTNDTIAIRPMVGLANSRTYAQSRLLGVATMDIAAGSYGWITTRGAVNGINLLALCPGGVATNDNVYLNSVDGTYTTNNNPLSMGTNYVVYVGQVGSTNQLLVKDAPDPQFAREIYGTVQTTDGTATTLYAITPPNNSTLTIVSYVGASTGGAGSATNASAGYPFFTTVATTNNTTRIVGTSGGPMVTPPEDITAWACFWTNHSATTVHLRVVGVAATAIQWDHATTVRGRPFRTAY